MKKGIAIVFVCVSILLLISMPVVSAGWFNDFLGGVKNFFGDDAGITGNPIDGNGCVDSDGGVMIFLPGVVMVSSEEGESEYFDSCSSSNQILEYYCDWHRQQSSMTSACPYGGVCIDEGSNAYCDLPEDSGNDNAFTCSSNSEFSLIGAPIRTRQMGNNQNLYYCSSTTLNWEPTKSLGTSCIENFECSGNACIEGECISLSQEFESQRNLLQGIYCNIYDFFTIGDNFDTCMEENFQPGSSDGGEGEGSCVGVHVGADCADFNYQECGASPICEISAGNPFCIPINCIMIESESYCDDAFGCNWNPA